MSPETDLQKNVIIAESLVKIYKTKDIEVLALQGLDLPLPELPIMAMISPRSMVKSNPCKASTSMSLVL